MLVVKQYGNAQILIIKCKIIGIHKLFVFLYIAPKYIPNAIVQTTFVIMIRIGCPNTPKACPNPNMTEEVIIAIFVLSTSKTCKAILSI